MVIKPEGRFTWPDYLVFALSLLISAAIGIYYAFQSRRKQNTSEYLMGSRDMGILPVSTSLVVSFISDPGSQPSVRGVNGFHLCLPHWW